MNGGYPMKRTIKSLAVAAIAALVSCPAAALAANYPVIKPKNRALANADHSFFKWILDNFPWVMIGIAVICFICAAIGSSRRRRK